MWLVIAYGLGAAASAHGASVQLSSSVRGARWHWKEVAVFSLLWPLSVNGKLQDALLGHVTDEDVQKWRQIPTTLFSPYVEVKSRTVTYGDRTEEIEEVLVYNRKS